MTLILSCATQDYVIQVSDRRLVRADDGSLFDDETNKAVLFCGRMAFSYTGLAEMEGIRTDLWLTRILADPSCISLSDAVQTIRTRATESFQKIRLPAEWKRHCFVGVGWTRSTIEEPFRPIICTISNCHDERDAWLPKARSEFRIGFVILSELDNLSFLATGQPLYKEDNNMLVRTLVKCARKQAGPNTINRILISAARRTADRNPSVGKSLLTVCLPKETIGSGDLMVISAPPLSNGPSFWYVPSTWTNGIQYGPSFVCEGLAATNFRAGPL